MALGPRLPNTDKPRQPLARHGACRPRPMDPNAPGPDRALLHRTMKHTAKLPATLAGEKYFIVEDPTDDMITRATNTLAATTDAWDVAVGHPTARKDRVQDTKATLTPDLFNHLVTLTSPPEQHNRKTEGPKVTDCAAFIDRPPDTPTVTLTCHQHTWWVAQWNTTGTTDIVHTFTPEAKPASPLALGDRFKQSTHHTNHPRAHWLALKKAMHWTVDAPARTLCCPRRVSHSLATWQPTYEDTGQQGRNAGCPGPRTRNERSSFAPPAYKNTQTNFVVCTDHNRGKDRHTAYFTATHRSRPPNRHQKNPGQNRSPVQGERTPRPAGPNRPNRSQKRPQHRHRPIHNRSQRPQRAHSSGQRNGQTARKYTEYSEARLENNRSNLYGSGARYRADSPHQANLATCS